MSRKARRVQAAKSFQPRNYVALDALGITDGNRRRTRMDNDSRRTGTKYGAMRMAMMD